MLRWRNQIPVVVGIAAVDDFGFPVTAGQGISDRNCGLALRLYVKESNWPE
jgi:hypothetical protein